ncbi:Rieske (2Fe-2S) protein [Methanomethylovorans sp.]
MVCPLSTGALEGHILRCSCHGWRYDIKTGEYLGSRDITLKVYDNMIKNARTYIYI